MRRPTLPEEYGLQGPYGHTDNDYEWWLVRPPRMTGKHYALARIRAYKDGRNEAQTYGESKFGSQRISFPDTEAMLKWLEAITALGEL